MHEDCGEWLQCTEMAGWGRHTGDPYFRCYGCGGSELGMQGDKKRVSRAGADFVLLATQRLPTANARASRDISTTDGIQCAGRDTLSHVVERFQPRTRD